MIPIEDQIKTLIAKWQSKTDRPVDKDCIHNNLKSDEKAMEEIGQLIKEIIQ